MKLLDDIAKLAVTDRVELYAILVRDGVVEPGMVFEAERRQGVLAKGVPYRTEWHADRCPCNCRPAP